MKIGDLQVPSYQQKKYGVTVPVTVERGKNSAQMPWVWCYIPNRGSEIIACMDKYTDEQLLKMVAHQLNIEECSSTSVHDDFLGAQWEVI